MCFSGLLTSLGLEAPSNNSGQIAAQRAAAQKAAKAKVLAQKQAMFKNRVSAANANAAQANQAGLFYTKPKNVSVNGNANNTNNSLLGN